MYGPVPALKFVHTPGGVDKFLLAGEKGVACRANADFDIVAGRARAIRRTAGTNDDGFDVVGMNLGLHFVKTPQASKEGTSRNQENNPILARWEQIARTRKRESAVFAPDGSVLRTFAAIEEEAMRWTEAISNQPGKVVCLELGNCAEWPAILLAVWRAGRTLLPMECQTPTGREQIQELCGVGVRLVLGKQGLEVVPVQSFPIPASLRSDLLKLTSGTTAKPRVIRVTATQLLADCDNICDTMGLREDDRSYGVVSFAHSYGFSNLITPLLCRGISLVAASDVMPRALVDGFASSRATVFPGVPAIFRALAEVPRAANALRLCVSAGAPLTNDVARKFLDSWGLKIHSLYGASECGGICYDPSDSADVPPGYVGPPLRNVDVRMEDKGPSQIEVRGNAVGSGYYPDEDAEDFRDGMFRPSDLLAWKRDGYVITGRISDLINVGGRKVNPAEIERVLRLSPRVRDVVVLGVPASGRGEEVAACVAGEATEGELRRLCSLNLPAWQMPRRWLFCDEIPLNARGKISRADLRARMQ
jgi:long-chain acyl-CoA synthetase